MANLRVLVPDATTNYVKNPSLKIGTTGWTANGATITRSLERARFGIASLKLVTNGSVVGEGAYYRVNWLQGIQTPLTVSAYVRGTGRVRIRLIDYPYGMEWASQPIQLNDLRWQRITISGRCTGSNDVRLYVETDGRAQTVTFYVDGAQMEPHEYMSSYCDGDQPGCRWNTVAHSTISTRDASTRAGGKWVDLAGPCREDDDIYATVMGGFGMPPIALNMQNYAELPGAFFQNTKIQVRPTNIIFHVKKEALRARSKPNLSKLHELRQQLVDIFKPDRTAGSETFLFEYDEGARPVYIAMRYEAGLEGDWDIRNQWYNGFPVRFLAVSPFLVEDDQEVKQLDIQETISMQYAAARQNGVWNNMNYGFNSVVRGAAIGPNGEIYAVGDFSVANNNTLATDPLLSVNRIAYWDGEKWNRLGASSAFTGLTINAVAVAPNGYVYVVGDFTSIGGVAANRIAYWNGSTWNAMGTGLDNDATSIAIAPNGNVYVGGAFTTAGGVTVNYVARWDGSWHSLGASIGLNNDVNAIAISLDGASVYLGGVFTDENGNPGSGLNRVALYNVSGGTFSALSTGMNNSVVGLLLAPDGSLYACGVFTTAGGGTANKIARWDGSAWNALGSGLNNSGFTMAIGGDGTLLVGGLFTVAGGVNVKNEALWNGFSWGNLDINFITSTNINLITPNGDFFVGGNESGNKVNSGITTVENVGSAEALPVVYILGPGNLRWLENQTTKARMYFDLTVLANEEVFIDFGAGTIESTVRGNLLFTLLPGSDFRKFSLAPGNNKIATFMINDVNAYMQISYVPRHWSADAVARGEEL